MSPKRFAVHVALAVLVIALALGAGASVLLRDVRVDVTQRHQFSLSASTLSLLRGLPEPVTVALYVDRAAVARDAKAQVDVASVRAVLGAFSRDGAGRALVQERAFGAEAAADAPKGAFAVVITNAVNQSRIIASFPPDVMMNLERRIAQHIAALAGPPRPRVAVISTLPDTLAVVKNLADAFDVVILPDSFTDLPARVDVVAVWHPWLLTPGQLYRLDQYLLGGGRAMIALDRAFLSARAGGGAGTIPAASDLDALLPAYGVLVSHDVVLDRDYALQIALNVGGAGASTAPQPLYLRAALAPNAPNAAALRIGVNMAAASAVTPQPSLNAEATFSAALMSSTQTGRLGALDARDTPSWARTVLLAQGAPQAALAVRAQGVLASAFGSKPPEGVAVKTGHLARGAQAADMVVVGDADFLMDDMYLIAAPAGPARAVADNGAFVEAVLAALTQRAPKAATQVEQAAPARLAVADSAWLRFWTQLACIAVAPTIFVVIGAGVMWRRRKPAA